MDQKKG